MQTCISVKIQYRICHEVYFRAISQISEKTRVLKESALFYKIILSIIKIDDMFRFYKRGASKNI